MKNKMRSITIFIRSVNGQLIIDTFSSRLNANTIYIMIVKINAEMLTICMKEIAPHDQLQLVIVPKHMAMIRQNTISTTFSTPAKNV